MSGLSERIKVAERTCHDGRFFKGILIDGVLYPAIAATETECIQELIRIASKAAWDTAEETIAMCRLCGAWGFEKAYDPAPGLCPNCFEDGLRKVFPTAEAPLEHAVAGMALRGESQIVNEAKASVAHAASSDPKNPEEGKEE